MSRSCPWCCEPLSRRGRGAPSCPHCGRPLTDDHGRELRPVDLRCEQVEALQRDRFRRLMSVGLVVVAVISAAVPLLHLGVVVVVPLLVALHLLTIRVFLVRRSLQLLKGVRRAFTRWICRLSFLWIGIPGYGLAAVPVVGIVAGAATFAGLTALAHHYTLWNLSRERLRQPLSLWEHGVLWGLVLITVISVAVLVLLALLLGWSVNALLELLANARG